MIILVSVMLEDLLFYETPMKRVILQGKSYNSPTNRAFLCFFPEFSRWAFCTAGATIVSGAVAERVKSPTYAAFAFFMTSFIYPVVVAWSWGGGWLASLFGVGYMDFAGSGRVCRIRSATRIVFDASISSGNV